MRVSPSKNSISTDIVIISLKLIFNLISILNYLEGKAVVKTQSDNNIMLSQVNPFTCVLRCHLLSHLVP